MGNTTTQKAQLVSGATLGNNQAVTQLALFNEDGTAIAAAAPQADFAGADVTALKVELNAFLAKLEAAGLVRTS